MQSFSTATNFATVTVNLQPTSRKGEYFRAELGVDNSSDPVWLAITNVAVLTNGGGPNIVSTNQGNLLVAKATEAFLHDLDGNLISDSLWTNAWNGENRLIATESASGVPSAGKAKETWSHLPDGRWIERVIYSWNGSAYIAESTNRFIWDGQVLLSIVNHTNGLVTSFARGLDLSGSIQGAGGVGGLLAVAFGPSTNTYQLTTHFAAFDGNGNVSALVSATNGAVTANYEYGPFGELLRANGAVAKANPLRFSTKFQDEEADFLYYGYRYYNANLGRWLSRDPIDEDGGINIHAFVGNNPMGYIDPNGHQSWAFTPIPKVGPRTVKCGGVCGASIDDWIVDEINAQVSGWEKYKKDNPGKTDFGSYIPWSNGNQRYKDPKFFQFNTGTGCSTKKKGSEEGCGPSVTLCGKCVKSDILGNLMYGIVAKAAGFPDSSLNEASRWKRKIGKPVDGYDEEAYQAGANVFANLPKNFTSAGFCKEFNALLEKGGTFLRQGRSDGGYNDLSNCEPCDKKSTVKGHGGNKPPTYWP